MLNQLGFTEQEQTAINYYVRELGLKDYTKKLNKVCFYGNETRQHFLGKANLCWLLHKEKIPFITESKIRGKKGKTNIPDILVLKPLVAIEILHTETTEYYETKVQKAANGLIFINVNSHKAMFMNDVGELL